jgi:hypothetical protein
LAACYVSRFDIRAQKRPNRSIDFATVIRWRRPFYQGASQKPKGVGK